MEEKYLSIITNFGCHFQCPYCIVKNNNIDVPRTTLEGLDGLKDAIKAEGATIVSVSGGGDPLHNYPKHKDYYNKLFSICEEMNIPLEMHTSYIDSEFPYWRCRRVVYHCRDIKQISEICRYDKEIIRVVFVVDESFTEDKIMNIHYRVFACYELDELSFRQMVDKNYQITKYCQDYLRAGHKKAWYYIEQGDYNTYYVNGKIYYKFSEIKGE